MMLYDKNAREYLAAHEKRQIRGGQSGAQVWELEGKYILKHVQRAKLPEPEVFANYRNEAYFYQFCGQNPGRGRLTCLPEILDVQVSEDEILILMKKYQELSRDRIDRELLRRIMGALAAVHTWEIPAFLRKEQETPGYLSEEQIKSCLAGWRSVLAEHPGAFGEEILEEAAESINEIIGWHHGEEQVLGHGDFHWDNLLQRENGDIIICDWQGVDIGGASGDISFFLSRLSADGTAIEPEEAVDLYCRERFRLPGETVSKEDLLKHMRAANVITSFQFWHQYLHDSPCERVRGIYEKMVME